MEPRYYQTEAELATYAWMRANKTKNPVVVLPTGTGKSFLISMFARSVAEKRKGRTLILAHRKELIEQNSECFGCGIDVSVYSASVGERDHSGTVVVAQIQSCFRRGLEMGVFDIAIIDEAHLVPFDDESMYRKLIADLKLVNPKIRFIGVTATPYRMREGTVCSEDGIFNGISYDYPIAQAIKDGFLCPLTSRHARNSVDASGLKVVRGEFVTSEVEALIEPHVADACEEIVAKTAGRHSVLVFCTSVKHAEIVAKLLDGRLVTGETPKDEREATLEAFKRREFKFLANVDVCSVGFNSPCVDAIALLRATASRGLFIQMVGRGTRLHPGKETALVLDFGGNIRRLGPVDAPHDETKKVWAAGSRDPSELMSKEWICPTCGMVNSGTESCSCGFVRERQIIHDAKASDEDIMRSFGVMPVKLPEWYRVSSQQAFHHHSRDPNKLDTLRMEYVIEYADGSQGFVREWVCIEHEGFAGMKAREWWKGRSNEEFPDDVREAVYIIDSGGIASTDRIKVDFNGKFPEIKNSEIGLKPAPLQIAKLEEELDDIPF